MADPLNNTIRVLTLFLLVICFSSCERKNKEEQKIVPENESPATPKGNQSEQLTKHPFLEDLDNQATNESKSSEGLPASTLKDTGVKTPDPELPEFASAVLLELETELRKATSEKSSRSILNDLAKKYWIEDFETNISLKGVDFSTLFYTSDKFIKELRTGGESLNLNDDELKSSYAMFSIMALLSQSTHSTTLEVDHFFYERMGDSSARVGDLLLARIASQVRPFNGGDSHKNLKMLEDMGDAKNSIFRALAVVSGNTYLKDEKQLFDFYKKFEEDPKPEIGVLILDELVQLGSEAAFLEVERIMQKSKGHNDSIHIHAKNILESLGK